MSVQTSNRLTDLSARIRQARDRAKVASVESAEQSIEAGHLLIEAKAACKHGEWGPFLEMTGVHERQARRLMQIARSGLKADTVSDLGGIKGALEYLAQLGTQSPEAPVVNHSEKAREFIERRQLADDEANALLRELVPLGWNLPENLTLDEWLARGKALVSLARSMPALGNKHPEDIEATGHAINGLDRIIAALIDKEEETSDPAH